MSSFKNLKLELDHLENYGRYAVVLFTAPNSTLIIKHLLDSMGFISKKEVNVSICGMTILLLTSSTN
jgi:hypothetical protein